MAIDIFKNKLVIEKNQAEQIWQIIERTKENDASNRYINRLMSDNNRRNIKNKRT